MVINLVCPVCIRPLRTHTCMFSTVPIWVEPHEYKLGHDPLGIVCGYYLCPYIADEHPVIERVKVNG